MKYKRVMAIVLASAMMGGSMPVYAAAPNSHVVENTEQAGTVKASEVNPMYRLYNPNSGEHFYTASAGERKHLVSVGWRYEGIGWYAPTSGYPVYRVYNPNAGDHHYTTKRSEVEMLKKAGWREEDGGWATPSKDGGYAENYDFIPVYRQYNPNAKTGAHNFTTSKAESDSLVRAGWKDEGIAWYAVKKKAKTTTPEKSNSSTETKTVTPTVKPDNTSTTKVTPTAKPGTGSTTTTVPEKTKPTNTPTVTPKQDSGSTSASTDHNSSSSTSSSSEKKKYTDKDLFGYFGNPNIPEGMTEAEYGQTIVKLHPDIFQPLVDQANRCTTDLGKMIAVSKFIFDQGYIYQVNDRRTWQEGVDFVLGKQPYAQCEDVSGKTFILCCIVGLPVEKVADSGHAWNQVKLDGKWYPFDNVNIYHTKDHGQAWQNADAVLMKDAYVCVYGKDECGQDTPVEGVYPLNDENLAKDPSMSIEIDISSKTVYTYLHGNEIDHTFESLGYRD